MKVIFLDLDKTLLGDDYSPEPAGEAVREFKKGGFKIVFNSSKTRREQEYYRKALGIEEPFIVENGSAIFIPKGYFPFEFACSMEDDQYKIIELGERYEVIKAALDEISDEFGLKYYGNSTLNEIMEFTGLPRRLAELARDREYSETVFKWEKGGFEEVLRRRFEVSRGSRFWSVHGKTDKGKAAKMLLNLYSKLGELESYAVGDGLNDFPMFDVVDFAFIVGELKHPKARNIRSVEEIMLWNRG